MQKIIYRKINAASLPDYIQELARLRIEVFREFPYLYQGSVQNEHDYLDTYLRAKNFYLFAAFYEGKMIGATTCLPLSEETPAVKLPFMEQTLPLEDYTYFGESVLLKPYRGKGIGKTFFLLREAQAVLFNTPCATFCAVERPKNHPLRPRGHKFLDNFWQQLGYQKQPELQCQIEWEELPDGHRRSHTLTFWTKQL